MDELNQKRKRTSATLIQGSKEGSGEVMVPCHVQILANFTYHILYKPVFTSHEFSHQPLLPLNQRGYRETETTVIIDQTSMIVILKDVNDYTDRMWFLGSSFIGNY